MSLYRRRTFQASVVVLLAAVACVVTTAQRRKPHKLRATALAEVTTDKRGVSTARLIPITILDGGVFRDATMYKATPVPMALDDGVVYEAQKSGEVVGYVTAGRAAKDKDGAWSAAGKWRPPSAPKPAATPAPTAVDERPRLHRGDSSTTAQTPSPAASPSPSPSSSPAPTPSATATPVAQEPVPEDPNRPLLRRGRPEPQVVSSPSPAGRAPSSPSNSSMGSARLSGAPGMQVLVAVSDTESTDLRSFEFAWKKGEQAEMEAKLRRLALAQLPRENPPLNDRSLTHVAIRSLDLDLSNEAVMVLTAEIPGTATPARKGAAAKAPTHYLTLIARVDMEGMPQRVAVSMTDASRLDVIPRLELIDAVDVDGDGVAELLFRQYRFDTVSYVVFSIGRSTATKVFEGASAPLP